MILVKCFSELQFQHIENGIEQLFLTDIVITKICHMILCEQYTCLNYSSVDDPKCVVLSILVALLIISSLLSG